MTQEKHTVVRKTERRRPTPVMERFLTAGEAADMLGLSVRHVRALINDGQLPAYRLGPRSTRIKLSDIDAFLVPVVSDQ